jgi:hypothetical protein
MFWPAGPDADSAATLRAVVASVPFETVVMVPGGPGLDPLLEGMDTAARARLTLLDQVGDGSFASAFDQAMRTSGRADLVVLAGAWVLPGDWLEGLRSAATCDDTVAASFPLPFTTGNGLFTGLDFRRTGPEVEGARAVPAPAVHPRLWALPAPCAYLRRETLELLGGAYAGLRHPQTVLADLAARAVAAGLSLVLADNVWVEPMGSGGAPPEAELRVLSERHPWMEAARADTAAAEVGPLRRSLIAARAANGRLSVTIDARTLGASFGGTQTYTAALIRALALSGRVTVRAVVGDGGAAGLFTDCDVEVVTYEQAVAGIVRSDVVHRPQQVFSPADLALLRLLGERIVISHLDLIAYRSPTYHRSPDDWRSYRRTTRLALGTADRVIFLSEHARAEGISEELVGAERAAVVGIGVEASGEGESRRPERVPAERPLLLVLGADYVHKNRPFALRLGAELIRRRGWDGLLVLAGPHVEYGSSAALEAELLDEDPELSEHVVDLGPVAEPEKRWLLENAQALLCPSSYEGYGLTPLEAAAAHTPCAYPPLTSLVEILGREGATIVPWDPVASAAAVAPLLEFGGERDRHLALLGRALARCHWDSVVDGLCRAYAEAIESPYRASAPRAWEELEREQQMVEFYDRYHDLEARTALGLPLIDRGGLLTGAQQRGLMRVASRRWLRAPLLGPIGLLGELGADDD